MAIGRDHIARETIGVSISHITVLLGKAGIVSASGPASCFAHVFELGGNWSKDSARDSVRRGGALADLRDKKMSLRVEGESKWSRTGCRLDHRAIRRPINIHGVGVDLGGAFFGNDESRTVGCESYLRCGGQGRTEWSSGV